MNFTMRRTLVYFFCFSFEFLISKLTTLDECGGLNSVSVITDYPRTTILLSTRIDSKIFYTMLKTALTESLYSEFRVVCQPSGQL